MSETKFDPLKELTNLRDSIGKTVEQGIQSITGGPQVRVDMYEVDNSIIIRTAALDGVVPESIEVSMDEDILTFRGETHQEETPRNASYIIHERRFGEFSRSVRIPIAVKPGKAQAKLKNGCLTITLPIDEERDLGNRITVTPVEDDE